MDKEIKTIKKLLKLSPPTKKREERCSCCKKLKREVRVIIILRPTKPQFRICNECVELCTNICAQPQKSSPPPPKV